MTKKTSSTPQKGGGRKAYTSTKRGRGHDGANCRRKRTLLKAAVRELRERVTTLEGLVMKAPKTQPTLAGSPEHGPNRRAILEIVDFVNSRIGGLQGDPAAQLVMEATRFSPDPVGGQAHLSGNESLPSGGIADLPIEPARETLKRQAPVSSSKSPEES